MIWQSLRVRILDLFAVVLSLQLIFLLSSPSSSDAGVMLLWRPLSLAV